MTRNIRNEERRRIAGMLRDAAYRERECGEVADQEILAILELGTGSAREGGWR